MNRLVTELSGVRATALLALYARALDNGSAHPILGDRWAEEIITRLDFDFTQFRTAKKERYGVGVRTRQMDKWTTDFITHHPDATVLDLGAGLDSRVFRVNPPSPCHWHDIDYPDVIELRNRLYPAHQHHDTIGADLTHDSWLDQLQPHSKTRRGANDHRVTMALPCLEGIPHHLCRHEEHPGAAGAGRAHPALHVLALQRGVERAVSRQRTGWAGTCCTCLETVKALSDRGCHWCRSRTVSTPPQPPDG